MKNTAKEIKKYFPIFQNSEMVYLDSGATTQKPLCVLEDMRSYYEKENANPYRGAYQLSVKSTQIYNDARKVVADFINAKFPEEIVFTKNATEALNLVAYSYGMDNICEDDEVVLSIMEHHSNLVPWQEIARRKGAKLKYLYLNEDFQIDDKEIDSKITPKTKVVAIVSVSNVLGTVNNAKKIIEKAHKVGAVVVLDISQSVAHSKTDVQELDADFVAFSAHKMYGPLGIGVLYGKKNLLNKMTPFLMGGDMIEFVYEQETTYAELPNKFEAGTQNVGGAVGLASAIKFIQTIGFDTIEEKEKEVSDYAYNKLKTLPYVTVYAPKENRGSVISFNIKNIHPHDVSSLLDADNICIRAGNHCAQPLTRFLGIDSTCRISFGIYNTKEDIDKLFESLKKIYRKFEKYIKD